MKCSANIRQVWSQISQKIHITIRIVRVHKQNSRIQPKHDISGIYPMWGLPLKNRKKKQICNQDTAPSVLHGRTCCGTRTPRGHPTRAATWSAPPRSSSGRRPRPKQRNWPRRHRRGRCSKRLVLVELRYGKWPMYR